MYFEAIFFFYVLLNHFIGNSLFGFVTLRSFCNLIQRYFALTFTKLDFYIDMSIWFFVGKQYNRLNMTSMREHVNRIHYLTTIANFCKILDVPYLSTWITRNINNLFRIQDFYSIHKLLRTATAWGIHNYTINFLLLFS